MDGIQSAVTSITKNSFPGLTLGHPYAWRTATGTKDKDPNNVGGQQDCILMQYADADYEWVDVDSSSMYPFICETYV